MADGSRLRHTGRRSRANEGINKATVPRNRRAAMFVSSAAMRRGAPGRRSWLMNSSRYSRM